MSLLKNVFLGREKTTFMHRHKFTTGFLNTGYKINLQALLEQTGNMACCWGETWQTGNHYSNKIEILLGSLLTKTFQFFFCHKIIINDELTICWSVPGSHWKVFLSFPKTEPTRSCIYKHIHSNSVPNVGKLLITWLYPAESFWVCQNTNCVPLLFKNTTRYVFGQYMLHVIVLIFRVELTIVVCVMNTNMNQAISIISLL